MSLTGLPLDVFSLIVDYVVATSPIAESLPLRRLSKVFQYAVNGAFFERQVRNGSYSYADDRASQRMSRSDTFRYVHGHIHPYQRKHPFAVELGNAASLILAHDQLLRPIVAKYLPGSSISVERDLGDSQKLAQLRHSLTTIITYAVMEYLRFDMTNILHVFGYQKTWVPRYGAWSWAMITAVYVEDLVATDAILNMVWNTPDRECALFHCLRAGALTGEATVVKAALERGATIYQPSCPLRRSLSGSTVLEDACKATQYDVVSMLLESGIQDGTDSPVYSKAITCTARAFRSEDEAKLKERMRITDLIVSKAAPNLCHWLKSDAMVAAIGCENLPLVKHILDLKLTICEYGSPGLAKWASAAMYSSNGDVIRATLGPVIAHARSSTERALVDNIAQQLATWGAASKLLCIWEAVLQENVQDVELMDLMFEHARRDLHLDVLLTMYARGYLPDW